MSGKQKQWPKVHVRQPLVVTATDRPECCPDCGQRVLGRTRDGDWACPICGTVVYVASYSEASTAGLRKAMAV